MRWIFLLFGCIFLASCASQSVQPTPVLTRQPVTVLIDPAAEKVIEAIQECTDNLPDIAVFTAVQPVQSDNLPAYNLLITWNKTSVDDRESYPITSDKLALVVNSSNPISSLTRDQLIDIYRQQQKTWLDKSGASQEISLWAYAENDPVQVAFETLFPDPPVKIGSVNIAPDPSAMVSLVTSDPNALGFIPRSWLTDGLKEVTITPPLLDSYPILVILPNKENNPSRLLVACLQGSIGQKILNQYFRN